MSGRADLRQDLGLVEHLIDDRSIDIRATLLRRISRKNEEDVDDA